MGRTINQFRRLWRPGSPVSLSSSQNSSGAYSSFSVIETDGTEEHESSSYVKRAVHEGCDIDKDEDDYVCEINANDHDRLCKARAAHDLVTSDSDTLLAKRTLSAASAPHLRTQNLITKLDDVAKVVDLDVPTILQEQLKDPVLSIVRSWIERNTPPDLRAPEIRQSKGLLSYGQELDRLLIEENRQLLCYDEPSDSSDERNLRICLPSSHFLACFRMGQYNELGGHMGASKTYANTKRFYYWPAMFDWICALTADCLACQNNKPKPKHLNEVPLEEWQGDTEPFCAIHIDLKGPLHPPSNRNTHCLSIVDPFSRFLMVYPVTNTKFTKLQLPRLKNGYFILAFPSQSYMIEEQLFLIQTLSPGLRSWELPSDHVQLTPIAQMARYRPKTSISHVIGDVFRMMLALSGPLSQQNLPSRLIRVLITLLEKLRMKSSLVPSHRFLCLSNWDFIVTNINYVVQNFAPTCLLILTMRTPRKVSFSRNYFDHNFLRLC